MTHTILHYLNWAAFLAVNAILLGMLYLLQESGALSQFSLYVQQSFGGF